MLNTLVYCVLTVFHGLALISSISHAVDLILPNVRCSNIGESTVYTNCHGSDGNFTPYILPDTFNVDGLHPRVKTLLIRRVDVKKDYRPFPARELLQELTISKGNLALYDIRFPLNGLLIHVKRRIVTLRLSEVKLQTLTEQDFQGFEALETLSLVSCHIASISVSAFVGMNSNAVPLSSAATIPNSHLRTLAISWNRLTSLDWSFLKPIAESITNIDLAGNGLNIVKVSRSSPFTLSRATSVDLSSNELETIPTSILETFNASLNPQLAYVQKRPFCQKFTRCSCWELKPFVAWLKQNSQIEPSRIGGQLQCGKNDFDDYIPKQFPTLLDLYRPPHDPRFSSSCARVFNSLTLSLVLSFCPVIFSSYFW
ncbi:hypothetical protein BV898_06313 [Hypsibius exemplaris]|uniref:Uncharacterized protein n=1 Tax=Hypsibius exemplaris TaxID=2072580 RepID=A0A1W0WX43_HYPEX|nr:hypothetical protein BV898_06313 [Hypsibius exemplaris]